MSFESVSRIVRMELLAGAKLYRHVQAAGGHKWELVGARITPATLDATCERMLTESDIVQLDEKPGVWQQFTSTWCLF